MQIKVDNVFLDLLPGEEIDIDRKVKLFEEINTADGDVSYTFELPPTNHNLNTLGILDLNQKPKQLYQEIKADLVNDSGITLYKGTLKIEGKDKKKIEATFYSGNSEWISAITGSLKDLDFSEFDLDFSLADVEGTFDNTNGLLFPIFDKGKLSERISPSLVFDERVGENLYLNNDFHPFLPIKNILPKVFANAGLKISGSLLNDYVYNNLVTTNNSGNSQEQLEARSSFVGKTSTQSVSSGSFSKITWIDNVDPYYDGDENNFDTGNSRFVADVPMIVHVTFMLDFNIGSSSQRYDVEIRQNGVNVFDVVSYAEGLPSGGGIHELDAGDYLEVFAKPFTSTATCLVGSFFKIDVTKIKKYFAVNYVPDFSNIDFVKNIFKIFNVVSTYNPYSKTVNLELFRNIKNKQPQDLSQYMDGEPTTDYYEFIEEYGKKNKFSYSEASLEEIETYNETNVTPYGGGSIDLDNTYLQEEQDIVELDFTAPFQYINNAFGMSLLKLNYLGDEETQEDEITSVTDSSGIARFNFSGVPPFSSDVGDLIRIKETSTGVYIGTGVISVSGIGFFELAGVPFQDTCTGTFVKINYTENSNADPILALNFSNTDVSVISNSQAQVYVNENGRTNPVSYAYFFRHSQGNDADGLKHGLSFGDIVGNGFYQQNLIEQFYRTLDDVLNDPVKLYQNFLLPESVFKELDFTRPVRLKSKDANGLFYLNKISSYKVSYKPCTLELIKM